MKISDILAKKQNAIVTVRPEDTIETAATLLTSNKIGAMPVRDKDGKLAGVLSERDIVRGISEKGAKALSLPVSALMTSAVTTCSPDDEVTNAMATMHTRRFRHMPVLDDTGTMVGMISQGDLVQCKLEMAKMEVNVLRDYAIASR